MTTETDPNTQDRVRSMPCSGNEGEHGAENKPTGRVYRTVDELIAAECSPEVQAEYARLRAEEESSPNVELRDKTLALEPSDPKRSNTQTDEYRATE